MEIKRFFAFDLIKTIAIIMVVLVHVCSFWIYRYPTLPDANLALPAWLTTNFLDSFSRVCVNLFFLVTGALLLAPARLKQPLSDFLKKYLRPTIIIYLVWQIVYFFWTRRAMNPADLIYQLADYRTYLNLFLNPAYYPLWYLQALIWIYLFTPLIRSWLQKASRHQLEYSLLIWLIMMVAINGLRFLQTHEVGGLARSEYLLSYGGFFLFGHYLTQLLVTPREQAMAWTKEKPLFKFLDKIKFHGQFSSTFSLSNLLIYLISGVIIFFGAWWGSARQNGYFEYLYNYLGVPAVIGSLSLFCALLTSKFVQTHPSRLFTTLGSATLGIYLTHVIWLELFRQFYQTVFPFDLSQISLLIIIPATTILVLAASYFTTWLLKKIPVLRRLV